MFSVYYTFDCISYFKPKGLSEDKMQKLAVNMSAAPSECPMSAGSNTGVSECPMHQDGNMDKINPDNMVCNETCNL